VVNFDQSSLPKTCKIGRTVQGKYFRLGRSVISSDKRRIFPIILLDSEDACTNDFRVNLP
jgi:hypothetical protein